MIHGDRCGQADGTAEVYVLGGLEDAERRRFETHLQRCAACRLRVAEAREVCGLLLIAPPPVASPVGAEERLMRRLRDVGTEGAGDRRRRRQTVPLWAAAAALLLVLNAVQAWAWVSRARQVDRLRAQTAQAERTASVAAEFAAGTARDVRHISLEGTAAAPGAAADVTVARVGRRQVLLLAARGLSPLKRAQVYQLWLIHAGRRTSGGTFSVGPGGHGVLAASLPAALALNTMGVTREPDGPSRAPHGPKVLGVVRGG